MSLSDPPFLRAILTDSVWTKSQPIKLAMYIYFHSHSRSGMRTVKRVFLQAVSLLSEILLCASCQSCSTHFPTWCEELWHVHPEHDLRITQPCMVFVVNNMFVSWSKWDVNIVIGGTEGHIMYAYSKATQQIYVYYHSRVDYSKRHSVKHPFYPCNKCREHDHHVHE